MTATTATLLAAGIAAAASIITLILTLLGARWSEMRGAHRAYLAPLLTKLGDGVHGCLACTNVLRKRAVKQQEQAEWIARGAEAAAKLNAVRPQLRYALYGLDEPLRTISRAPSWVATYRDVAGTNADELVKQFAALGRMLDQIVRRSYRRGLPPTAIERWRISLKTKKVRKLWTERFKDLPARGEGGGTL